MYLDLRSLPLQKARGGHLYAAIDATTPTYIGKEKLVKLPRGFYHPGSQKLYNRIKNARREDATPETMRLEKLSK